MNKIDIADRVNSLRENAKKNEGDKKNLKNLNGKVCPFRDKICAFDCKLYRENRAGYECPFQEIPSMSWNLKALIKKIVG